ncbi:PAS domain S-box protein [Persicimonas caeni]|uniref:histidine kinase n=1 Tax=Persicimonas caeni TaxID=2292766 RepID=A0A4Y6PWR9_PERCE|nr:ATP-binding protein [Persicimonas caeni]QDG52782.1 PAS domain S-box protein [Persicimonas caeni]QED34004.1 PAS domain S-box protein [Persicimonas caeni]
MRSSLHVDLLQRVQGMIKSAFQAGDETSTSVADLVEEHFPAALLLVALDGRIIDANQRAAEFLERDPRDVRGLSLDQLAPDDCQDTVELLLARARRESTMQTCELQLESSSGRQIDVLVQCRPTEVDNEKRLLMCMCDISRWRSADPRKLLFEEQLQHSQKMEALGQLASGIAHDFNNLLTLITGYSRVLLDDTDPTSTHHQHLQKIARASKQATDLVAQLLAFSRDDGPRAAVVNLNQVLIDFESMLQRIIGEDIELDARLDPDLQNIRISPNQLDQVLMNLTVNARDAMPDGGQLLFDTAGVYLGNSRPPSLRHLSSGPYVKLTVADNGIGMSPEVAERIFEPFFTTKDLGEGTGLGLATARSIVRQYGGAITVQSEPGNGTTFELYFPTADSSVDSMRQTPMHGFPAVGSEQILLVDDHRDVRELAAQILASQGYRVTEAPLHGGSIQLDPVARYSLAIIDAGQPRPAVEKLVAQLRDGQPDIKILFLAGYRGPEADSPHTRVLRKPFTPDGLTRTVRELLDEPQ